VRASVTAVLIVCTNLADVGDGRAHTGSDHSPTAEVRSL
jgi:hypothetical protein